MSGNGVDIAAVYQLLSEVAKTVVRLDTDVADIRRTMATKAELADVRTDLATLRQEVRGYHASVVGHGIALTEHDERIGRVERHLGLPSAPS